VAELRPAGPFVRIPGDVSFGPEMRDAVGTRLKHPDGLCAPEAIARIVADPGEHAFTRDRIGDEHHASLVSRDDDAAVRDLGSVEFDLPRIRDHPSSIGAELSDAVAPTRLYLASTSAARLATLRAAGIEPVVIASDVDEDAAIDATQLELGRLLDPEEFVMLLARLKARAVAQGTRVDPVDPDRPLTGLVVGGDSAFELDGVIYGKPHLPDVAAERWRAQRGRSGVLHSGHWLVRVQDGRVIGESGAASSAIVHFAADIDDDELEAYIASGEPLEVAGAFTLDARGGAFIDRIEGDPHTVVGLGLPVLRRLVRELGVSWPSLWQPV